MAVHVAELIERALEAGLSFSVEGDALRLTGPKRAAALVEELRPHKDAILAALQHPRSEDEAVAALQATLGRIYAAYGAGPQPHYDGRWQRIEGQLDRLIAEGHWPAFERALAAYERFAMQALQDFKAAVPA